MKKSVSYNTQNNINCGGFICKLLCFNYNRYVFVLERHKSHYSIHRFNCCTVTFAAFDMAEKEKEVFNNLVYLRRCVRNCARNKLRNNQV